jgi:outer membrane receptor for ferric coprogen and ferric-rhodotorulic acid
LSARLKATFVKQSGEFPTLAFSFIDGFPVISTMVSQEDDSFWVFDASLSYRLPRRWGEVSLGVKNLFDEGFRFQDTDPAHPTIAPKQVAFVRFTLSY